MKGAEITTFLRKSSWHRLLDSVYIQFKSRHTHVICYVDIVVTTDTYITTNGSDYVSLNVTLNNRTSVTFQVRASSSATVGLSTEYMNYSANHMYEIVIGVRGSNVYYTQIK